MAKHALTLQPYRQFIEKLVIAPATALVVLDEVQDPQNVGAIIRSAAAFGVAGVFLPERRQAPITEAVITVSVGMVYKVPLVEIGNVNQTIEDLKRRGFWIYGLDMAGAHPLAQEQFDAPAAFVLGNEASGVRRKTQEHCDVLLSIPMHPRAESLNVAASAAVTLYAWSSQHQEALK